jgi:hypothetical protein
LDLRVAGRREAGWEVDLGRVLDIFGEEDASKFCFKVLVER